jgi:hypothetical protein
MSADNTGGVPIAHSNSDDGQAIAWEAAKRLVRDVEDAFGAADLARIAQGFTEDAVARFADFPEMRGRDAIMRFLQARFARTKGYKLQKTLHVVGGDMLANTWDASWEDAQTARQCSAGGPRSGASATAASRCGTRRSTYGKKADRPRHRWCSTQVVRPPR